MYAKRTFRHQELTQPCKRIPQMKFTPAMRLRDYASLENLITFLVGKQRNSPTDNNAQRLCRSAVIKVIVVKQ